MKKWFWIIITAIIVVVFFVISPLLQLYVNLLWFSEVGYRSVFTTSLMTRIGMGLAGGLVFFVIVIANMIVARRLSGELPPLVLDGSIRVRVGQMARTGIWYALLAAAAIFAIGVGSEAATHWMEYLRFTHAQPFGVSDPILHRDAGFYVFRLPFYVYLQKYLMFTLVMSAIAVTIIQYLGRAIDMISGYPRMSRIAIAHLSFLVGLILFDWAANYWLRRYGLLIADSGRFTGPTYTDAHVRFLALSIMAIATAAVGLLVLANIRIRHIGVPIAGVIVLMILSIGVGSAWPGVVQRFHVKPNEREFERPYISHSIKYTRLAYDLDEVKERQFPAVSDLTAKDVADNPGTIRNIRIWDYRQIARTYSQIQIIRPYYQFLDVDVDRYMINGSYQQVLLSPREINLAGLTANAQGWVNRHLIYTHGYGLCMSPANRVLPTGLPDLIIKDIPPVSATDLRIDNPAIYYGEGTTEYCFVRTREKEFDYPAGDDNVYTTYKGKAGIPCGGAWRRLVFGTFLGSSDIVFTSMFTKDSRILLWRTVKERVSKIAPFLRFDEDPYMVIANGKLCWIADAYTVSANYPYSNHSPEGPNYMRNSVKAVIDAYDGSVSFYVFNPDDPMIRTYAAIFPGMFKEIKQMPKTLLAHTRYPEWLYRRQAEALALYHMKDPKVFYTREDLWELPTVQYEGQEVSMDAYYAIMKLPKSDREEFVLMLPYVPTGERKNMIAWLGARCDNMDRTEMDRLLLFQFPKQQLVYGPMQLDSRINQEEDISEKMTLWGQQQSTVIQGTLLVIPIRDSILYVQPVYVTGTSTPLPELRRIIVAYGDQIVWDRTLDAALQRIFGPESTPWMAGAPTQLAAPKPPSAKPGAAPAVVSPAIADLARQANEHFQSMTQAQRDGDWAKYGQELDALGRILKQMDETK